MAADDRESGNNVVGGCIAVLAILVGIAVFYRPGASPASSAPPGAITEYREALAKFDVIETVYVREWKAIIKVKNPWHLKHKQIRLQDAQALWAMWARLASPGNVDRARISIVDLMGNEVGGSRVWGGSLIWVVD